MKPTTRKSIFQKQNDSIEEVKNYLKNFSKLLRRDFLAILVKMCAKALQIRTVREDWRTRTGMLQFMQQNWPKFLVLVNTETCIKWFCSNFEQKEESSSTSLGDQIDFSLPLREARDQFERAYFTNLLEQENHSMTRVAAKAQLERTHLYRKLRQLGIEWSKDEN